MSADNSTLAIWTAGVALSGILTGLAAGTVASDGGQHLWGAAVFSPTLSVFEATLLSLAIVLIARVTVTLGDAVPSRDPGSDGSIVIEAKNTKGVSRKIARTVLETVDEEPAEKQSDKTEVLPPPRGRSISAPASSVAVRRAQKRAQNRRKSGADSDLMNTDCVDLGVTELESCMDMLRGIDPSSTDSEEVKDTIERVLFRLEHAGDELTIPVLRNSHQENPHVDVNPFSEGVVRAWGLRDQPIRHEQDDGPSWAASAPLYRPVPSDLPTRLVSQLSIGFDEMALPTSPVTTPPLSFSESLPKWHQGISFDSVQLASWDFDPYIATGVDPNLLGKDLKSPNTLSVVPYVLRIFKDHGLLEVLNIKVDAMRRYLRKIENDYQANPYHNRVHGFDVIQTCHCVLMQSPALKEALSPIDKLALLLGAFVHDVGHPGFNNKLLAKLGEEPNFYKSDGKHKEKCRQLAQFALTYNSRSILENFHISRAFQLAFDLSETDANPFSTMHGEDFAKLRSLMVSLVLATDMENHFNMVTKLKHLTVDASGHINLLNLNDESEKETLLKAIIHACDVGNPAKPVEIACKWTQSISEEFWNQGDFELELGLKPERMLERQDLNSKLGRFAQAQGQLAFIKYIVKPLHEVLATQLPVFRKLAMNHLNEVVQHWDGVLAMNTEDLKGDS